MVDNIIEMMKNDKENTVDTKTRLELRTKFEQIRDKITAFIIGEYALIRLLDNINIEEVKGFIRAINQVRTLHLEQYQDYTAIAKLLCGNFTCSKETLNIITKYYVEQNLKLKKGEKIVTDFYRDFGFEWLLNYMQEFSCTLIEDIEDFMKSYDVIDFNTMTNGYVSNIKTIANKKKIIISDSVEYRISGMKKRKNKKWEEENKKIKEKKNERTKVVLKELCDENNAYIFNCMSFNSSYDDKIGLKIGNYLNEELDKLGGEGYYIFFALNRSEYGYAHEMTECYRTRAAFKAKVFGLNEEDLIKEYEKKLRADSRFTSGSYLEVIRIKQTEEYLHIKEERELEKQCRLEKEEEEKLRKQEKLLSIEKKKQDRLLRKEERLQRIADRKKQIMEENKLKIDELCVELQTKGMAYYNDDITSFHVTKEKLFDIEKISYKNDFVFYHVIKVNRLTMKWGFITDRKECSRVIEHARAFTKEEAALYCKNHSGKTGEYSYRRIALSSKGLLYKESQQKLGKITDKLVEMSKKGNSKFDNFILLCMNSKGEISYYTKLNEDCLSVYYPYAIKYKTYATAEKQAEILEHNTDVSVNIVNV